MALKGSVTRRDFLRTATCIGAGVALGGAAARSAVGGPARYASILPASVIGANERIHLGFIGVGGMGTHNLGITLAREDCVQVAVCDLFGPHRERAAGLIRDAGHPAPAVYTYHEELIADSNVDAVVVCTPDHWHAIPSIMACDAGKDVFCEKPLATTIEEGRAMTDAARRNDTVFQCGTMQRSGEHFQEAVELVRSGYIGKVSRVATWIHDNESLEGIGNPPDGDPPEGLDWDRYLGWTPKVPFNANRFLHNFRWFLDYSGGKMTDWGAHLIDIALWGMGEDKAPRRVTASGGRFVLTDNRTTPDTLEVLYEFDDYVLSFSNRVYNGYPGYGGSGYGTIFFGTLGTLRVDRGGYWVTPHSEGSCEARERGGSQTSEPHWANFFACIRERKRPISDVETCHRTTTTCHMGTCAYVAGGKLEWDADKERFVGRPRANVREANRFAYRPYANGWSLEPPHRKDWPTG